MLSLCPDALMRTVLLFLAFSSSAAFAEEPPAEEPPAEAAPVITEALATYRQLAWELHQLAKRDAWSGVERTYIHMVELGLDIGRDDHMLGATSSATIGDVAETLKRLRAAHALGESREVIEWMYRLDTKYGAVRIVDERKKRPDFESTTSHFMPDANKAVQFATRQLESGTFEGLLPAGTYRYGREDFDVVVGETVELVYAK